MAEQGHNLTEAVKELDGFLERMKDLHDAAEDIKTDMKDEYTVMKSKGFDTKVLRKLVTLARETPAQREKRHEQESMLEVYKDATNLE